MSISIPPLPSGDFRDRAIASTVSDIMLDDCASTRKKEIFDGLSTLSQKKTPWCIAVTITAGIWMGRFCIMASLWWRYVFASDEFFCSKSLREEAQGSVGIDELSAVEPISTSVQVRLLSLVSNLFLLDTDDADCAIIEFNTS